MEAETSNEQANSVSPRKVDLNELVVYDPSPLGDALMLNWWAQLMQDDELETMLPPNARIVSEFFAEIRAPRTIFYKERENAGVWFVAIMTPVFQGAYFDMWCARPQRQSRAVLTAAEDMITSALERFPVLVGVTNQEKLLDEHRRLGYTIVGSIPGLWNAKDTYILYLTKENFMSRQTFSVRRAS